MTPTTTTLVEAAVAGRLAELGVCRYQPSGAYPTGGPPPIFHNAMPELPETAVTVTVYNVSSDRDEVSLDWFVQIRARHAGRDPRPTNDLLDAIHQHLNLAYQQTWPGGVRVLLCKRMQRAPLGADQNGRFERADSYRLTLNPIPQEP